MRQERLHFSMNGASKTYYTWAGLVGSRAGAAGVWPFVTDASEVRDIGLGLTQGQRYQLQAQIPRIALSC